MCKGDETTTERRLDCSSAAAACGTCGTRSTAEAHATRGGAYTPYTHNVLTNLSYDSIGRDQAAASGVTRTATRV